MHVIERYRKRKNDPLSARTGKFTKVTHEARDRVL
jgi:hypothetical protein